MKFQNRVVFLILTASMAASMAVADPAAVPSPPTTAPAAAAPAPAVSSPSAPADALQPSPALHDTNPAPREEDTASYTDGYSDGCASANLRYARQEHVKPNRDAKLYDSDKGYHDGWDHGYRKCEDKVTPGGLAIPGNSVVL
jgi:hypothetical protein